MAATHFNAQSFEEQVAGGSGLALVDFWADWCNPCKMLGPTLEELADDLDGSIIIGKVNIDDESNLAERFSVMSIPTVLLFRDGREIDRSVGLLPKQKYLDMISAAK